MIDHDKVVLGKDHWLAVMVEIAADVQKEKERENGYVGSWLIGRYHDALGELAQASGENLGYYTIPWDKLEPVAKRSKDVHCEADFFGRQVARVLEHFKRHPVPDRRES
jgi:hypothetical protein